MIDSLQSEIFNFQQRSPDWYEIRRGRLTASKVSSCFTKVKLQLSKRCMDTVATELVAEKELHYEKPDFDTFAMERGRILEDLAIRRYEKVNKCIIESTGFVSNDEHNIGCSPDGINWFNKYGLEIKCPMGPGYLRCTQDGEWRKYIPQCVFSAMILGFDKWRLYIFNEHVKDNIFVKDIYVDQYRDQIIECIQYVNNRVQERTAELRQHGSNKVQSGE